MSGRLFIVVSVSIFAIAAIGIGARALHLPDPSLYPLFIAGVAALVMLRRRTST